MAAFRTQRRPMSEGTYQSVPLASLRFGTILKKPILDETGVLLLASGMTITPAVIEKLKARGQSHVRLDLSEVARLCVDVTPVSGPVAGRGKPGTGASKVSLEASKALPRKGRCPIAEEDRTVMATHRNTTVDLLQTTINGQSALNSRELSLLEGVSSQSIQEMVQDVDVFAALGIEPVKDRYPFQHSAQVTMLALSMGKTLGLDEGLLHDLAIGCLVHDLGMLRLESQLYESPRLLTSEEFSRITQHPQFALEMMRELPLPITAARMVAYQMHERLDGSGYPRGRVATQIHPLSKIAAVADVFVAIVSPRPHRAALDPYSAMTRLLQWTKDGKFDVRAVRALLHVVSLFPLGSMVELNDGRVARVLRANREEFGRPVVEIVTDGSPGELIDLSTQTTLSVIRTRPELATQSRDETSLDAEPGEGSKSVA